MEVDVEGEGNEGEEGDGCETEVVCYTAGESVAVGEEGEEEDLEEVEAEEEMLQGAKEERPVRRVSLAIDVDNVVTQAENDKSAGRNQ